MTADTILFIGCFGGFVPSVIGGLLFYESRTGDMSRKDFVQWSLFGLAPFVGWIFGVIMLIDGLHYFFYKDHEDWWNQKQ